MLGYIFRKDTGGPMCLVPVDGFSELVFFFLNQVGSYPIWKFRLDNQYNVFFSFNTSFEVQPCFINSNGR